MKSDDLPELCGLVGMDQSLNNPLHTPWAVGGGRDVEKEGKVRKSRLVTEEFAQLSERIWGAAKLAAMGQVHW